MKIYEIINETILSEDKLSWLIKNQGPRLMNTIHQRRDKIGTKLGSVEKVAEFFINLHEKYADYLSQLYLSNQVNKLEDLYKSLPLLNMFEKIGSRLPKKNIGNYSLKELEQTLEPYMVEKGEGEESDVFRHRVDPMMDAELIKSKRVIPLVRTSNFQILIPLDKEASQYLGRDTKWCVSSMSDEHNAWDTYKNDGNLYVIRAGDKRFAMHVETGEFRNVVDDMVSKSEIAYLSKFPAYKRFLEGLIQKHYFDKDVIKTYQPLD